MNLRCKIRTEFVHSKWQVLKWPSFFCGKIIKFFFIFYRLRCFPKVTLVTKRTEINKIRPISKSFKPFV